jgi:hypothetical protein
MLCIIAIGAAINNREISPPQEHVRNSVMALFWPVWELYWELYWDCTEN